MRQRNNFLATIATSILLGACGGGDGDGGTAPNTVSLNAQDELRYLAGTLDTYMVTAGIIRALRNAYQTSASTQRTVNCTTGTARFDGSGAGLDDNQNPTGTMRVTYDSCEIGGRRLHGEATLTAEPPISRPGSLSMEVNLDDVGLRATNTQARLVGTQGSDRTGVLNGSIRTLIDGETATRQGSGPSSLQIDWAATDGSGSISGPNIINTGYSGSGIAGQTTSPTLEFPAVFSEAVAIPLTPTGASITTNLTTGEPLIRELSIETNSDGAGRAELSAGAGSRSDFSFSWGDIWPNGFAYSRRSQPGPLPAPPSNPPSGQPETPPETDPSEPPPSDGDPDQPQPPATPNPSDTMVQLQGIWARCAGNIGEILDIEANQVTVDFIEFEEEDCAGSAIASFTDTAEFSIGEEVTTSQGVTAEEIDFTILESSDDFFELGEGLFNIVRVSGDELVFGDIEPFGTQDAGDRPTSLRFDVPFFPATEAAAIKSVSASEPHSTSAGARSRWLSRRSER